MSRNVYISFLGTNKYVDCNYFLEEDTTKRVENVQYIQQALLQLNYDIFKDNDSIITFCTEASYRANYLNNGLYNPQTKSNDLPNEGLELILKKMNFPKGTITHKIIKEGFSESEIWDVFRVVNTVVNKNDNIYFDITHAFRYLPMMGLVLLNYLKVTKNIKVKGIYYGAFEKLGFASTVQNLPLQERDAPILNLLGLFTLNDWTQATHNFVSLGNTNDLSSLLTQNVINQFEHLNKKDKNKIDESVRVFSKELKNLSGIFSANRGKEIITAKVVTDIRASIKTVSKLIENESNLAPLSELLEKVNDKISSFRSDHLSNGFIAVDWCINHNLVQQGITLLQEFLISYVLDIVQLDFHNKKYRNTVNGYLSIGQNDFKFSDDLNEKTAQNEIITKLEKIFFLKEMKIIFEDLTRNRNDIQHAGFNNNPYNYSHFEKRLKDNFEKFKKIQTECS